MRWSPAAFRPVLSLLLVLAGGPSIAQSGGGFYAGKQIQLIIPSSTGGGYDLYGRLVAQFIGKYLPGAPGVVPVNMPCAAGLAAARYVYEAGVQDGTVLGLFYSTALLDPVMNGQSASKFDPTRFNYIGSANSESFITIKKINII